MPNSGAKRLNFFIGVLLRKTLISCEFRGVDMDSVSRDVVSVDKWLPKLGTQNVVGPLMRSLHHFEMSGAIRLTMASQARNIMQCVYVSFCPEIRKIQKFLRNLSARSNNMNVI
jgi:hypothetical protein